MPQTTTTTYEDQILGGVFSKRESIQKAVEAIRNLYFTEPNLQVIQLHRTPTNDPYAKYLVGRGFTAPQARYYEKALQAGKSLAVIYDVTDPSPIIDIFDRNKATYCLRPKSKSHFTADIFVAPANRGFLW